MRSARTACAIWIISVVCLLIGAPTKAQDDPAFQQATQPFASYHGGNVDKVDLLSGNLSVDIPLMSYPQRGGKLGLTFYLHYHSGPAMVTESCDSNGSNCSNYAPGYDHGADIVESGTAGMWFNSTGYQTPDYTSTFEGLATISPEGVHQFGPTDTSDIGTSNEWRALAGKTDSVGNAPSNLIMHPNTATSSP